MLKRIFYLIARVFIILIFISFTTASLARADQNFGGGGSTSESSSDGGSSGGDTYMGGVSQTTPVDPGNAGSSEGSNNGVDEAAAAWFNEQARIKQEQEAALAALLLQQQLENAKPKATPKKVTQTKKEKPVEESALSGEINALKENAAVLANEEYAEKAPNSDLSEVTDSAVVTDLVTEEDVEEEPVKDFEEKEAVDSTLTNISGSTDAAMSKYIEDSLLADPSKIIKNETSVYAVKSADQGNIISKTSKIALISVLLVVLVIIFIIGLVIIMIKKGYWNIESIDEDFDENDYFYADQQPMV